MRRSSESNGSHRTSLLLTPALSLGGDSQSFADMLQAQAQAQAEHEQQQQHSARAGSRPVANMNVQSEVNKLAGVDFGMPLDPVVTSTWQSGIQVQNKENRHPSAPRRLIDPHPQATKEVWNSQDYLQTQPRVETSQKRAHPGSSRHQATHEEEDEESEDEVFQRDSRPIDYSRRHTIQSANPSKRARHEGSSHQREEQLRQREESLRLREESIRQRELSQPMPSFARDAAVVDNLPLPQIAASQAKVIVQHMTQGPRKVQVRRPWSRSDEDLLIQHIGEYGCAWSELEKIGGYERDFGNMQVDLKDKARNLKTAFLKYVASASCCMSATNMTSRAGGPRTVLPYNFHQVRLGKKEIAAVHKVYPEYDQELELEEALLNQ